MCTCWGTDVAFSSPLGAPEPGPTCGPLKGHGNEADFLEFLQKLVRHRSLTLPFKLFRFWLRIRGDIRNQKTTPRLASRGVGDSPPRRVGESVTLRLGESGSRRLPDSVSRRVGFCMFKRKLGESESRLLPDLASRGVANSRRLPASASPGVAMESLLKFF
jgi:hypothetical protein